MTSIELDGNYYNFTQQLQGRLFQAMQKMQPDLAKELGALPPMLQIRRGYAESPAWFMVQAAEFDPEPLTVANLRVRDIYASEGIVAALLEMLAGEKWLAREGRGYGLTPAGHEILKQLRGRAAKFLTPTELPLPEPDLRRLIELLHNLFNHCLDVGSPPGSWCLAHSRRRAPAADAPPLLQINQFMADFNAFRDDGHMAAWQAENVPGYVWEAFSFIHAGQAKNGVEVYDKLFYRGYSAGEYETALHSLVSLGWLEASHDGNYRVTATGHEAHASVEAATDRYFYAPWAQLRDADQAELQSRLQTLSDKLSEIGST